MADDARCVHHPENTATALCSRCGTFICEVDRREVLGAVYCADCAKLPGVDPVEDYRARHFGKPDLWAWVMGLSALPQLWATIDTYRSNAPRWWVAANAAAIVLDVCYFLGQRWTRYGIFVTLALVVAAPLPPDDPRVAGMGLTTKVVAAALWAVALAFMWVDTRNQLFFRLDVPRPKLERAYLAYASNRIAKVALGFGLVGLVLPGLSFAGIPMAVTAVWRAQSGRAQQRGLAIASLITTTLVSLFWVAAIVALQYVAKRLGVE